jgi:subtilisin-like proprotein convertase family protein
MTNPRLARLVVAAALASPIAHAAADATRAVGRVRVTELRGTASKNGDAVSSALDARYAPPAGKRFADKRVISVRPRLSDPTRFDATIYDYTVEKAFELTLDARGRELSRKEVAGQPARAPDEFADAVTIVRENPDFAEALASGALTPYEPMPSISVDADGCRLVNVGVISAATAGQPLERNEIVSVHIPSGTVVRYPQAAPETSRAALMSCGPAILSCGASVGPCTGYYQVLWPTVSPVWKFNIRHPSCTSSVQLDGTGLELTDVYYQGRLILKRAEIPVLNVVYSGDVCGPYRDYLKSENCFQANGTDVPTLGSGIRVASSVPSTLCESGSDAGNFKGVAIFDQGDALWLMTEMDAGWYRYVMEWRLHLDGTIEPIIGFGAVSNSCTCNLHYHHGYWRFEWAIDAVSDGTTDDPATGINTLERRHTGTPNTYDPIATEGTFLRPISGGDQDFFRIKNPATGNGYLVEPGLVDGNANGDAYGQWDFAGLALNPNEIDDPNGTDTSINIGPWLGGEALGTTKRLVTWYHATYTHNDPNGTGESCELAGPKLVPNNSCAPAAVSVDKSAYRCSAPISIALADADLAGSGSTSATVYSATEPTPESVILTESPAGSGSFHGTITSSSAAPVHGDGKISVTNGDTIHVHYLDASSCGSTNVPVDTTAPVDCVAPAITNVQAVPGVSSASVGWDTNESATSIVHYGTTLPTRSTGSTAGSSTSHAVALSGLAPCTTYYYWIESADSAGNTSASNNGGGTFAFTTGAATLGSFTSVDTPLSIPDNSSVGVTSTLAVPDASLVQDVNVTVNATHPFDRDLSFFLITPASTSITLALRRGSSGDNYTNTVFDDEAAVAISAGTPPFTGSFRPETPLSAADGAQANGNWKLKATDLGTNDVGTIDSWKLDLAYANVSCTQAPPPPVQNGMTASLVSAATSTLHLAWTTSPCPATNYHLVYGSLPGVSTYLLDGAVCGLGPAGSYDWVGFPAGSVWFDVVADDGGTREGSWGTDHSGSQRKGTTASGLCGFTTRDNSATCP